ncbi:hypothetical protein [Halarcobacter ebronensis]|uniref:Uncharacterized protein n=1 Tax=Halarcobacter ebronensis TaxID=1462615 RepID=A0A4Q1ARJ8_9BACT|nr:hypothetical protein [Halarcobacter ebronensis]QKF80646.1 hypothetical protein AEBR_0128 [Halarcobacter ebronensis]RXK08447.1 hypothetical protein CRV07_01185 [Halarcobacter ebronensis]
MIEIASQIVFCLVIAAFIGFLIGLLIGRAFCGDRRNVYNSVTSHGGAAAGNIYNKPLIRSTPRPTGKDDLKLIEGIDKEMEQKLNVLGIYHFDQIAKWSPKNCHWVEEYFILEDNQIREQDWIEKAKKLSNIN